VNLYEIQAKRVLSEAGIAVPPGFPAASAEAAAIQYRKSGLGCVMIKAQVLSGARAKAGGILEARSEEEVRRHCEALIGKSLQTEQSGRTGGETVQSVLIEEKCPPGEDFYLAVTADRKEKQICILAHTGGGSGIEDRAGSGTIRIAAPLRDIGKGESFLRHKICRENFFAGHPELAAVASNILRLFVQRDCALIEINPLRLLKGKDPVALDAKMAFDPNAFFRQPVNTRLLQDQPRDKEVASGRRGIKRRADDLGLSYVPLDGRVGCLVNGAGLAMATLDAVAAAGGAPANFLDIGGAAEESAVREGFLLLLNDSGVHSVLVNIFGGIVHCDMVARALADAYGSSKRRVPAVVRLEGTRASEGTRVLKSSGLDLTIASGITEAAALAVKTAAGDT